MISAQIQGLLGDASMVYSPVAIAALGIKTSLAALSKVGPRAIGLMVAETLFIGVFVLL